MAKQRPVISPHARKWAEEQQFKGHGRIKCNACGEPLRDHKLTEPCPAMQLRPGEQITTSTAASAAQENRRNSEGSRT